MFHLAYCNCYLPENLDDIQEFIEYCVTAVHVGYPTLKEKLKIHLLLHLVEDMKRFGPAVSFCSERCGIASNYIIIIITVIILDVKPSTQTFECTIFTATEEHQART